MTRAATTRVVSSIVFMEDGSVVLTYMDPTQDLRNRGLLTANHQLQVQPGEAGKDYLDEIEDVRDAVNRLLADALEDFASTDGPDSA